MGASDKTPEEKIDDIRQNSEDLRDLVQKTIDNLQALTNPETQQRVKDLMNERDSEMSEYTTKWETIRDSEYVKGLNSGEPKDEDWETIKDDCDEIIKLGDTITKKLEECQKIMDA